MARIALGITLLLLLATSYFGFETRSKIQGLNDDKAALTTKLNAANQSLAHTQTELKGAQDDLAKAKDDLKSAQDQAASLQSSLDGANGQIADLKGQVDTLTKKLASVTSGTSTGPAPVGTMYSQAELDKAVSTAKADLQTQVDELNQVKETLTAKVKDDEAKADELDKELKRIEGGIVRNGLQGQVLAVNQGFNFVVLSIGDHQGAVANAEMILTRGGSQIGKVRITSVEPATSVADIIPGSLARGVRVEPGDLVIFPGS